MNHEIAYISSEFSIGAQIWAQGADCG